MRGPPTGDLDQRREEQLELVHARQKSQAKASHIATSPSDRHSAICDVQQRGGSVPMYDPRDRVFSSSNTQHVSELSCASGIAAAWIEPTVRSCAGARSAVFLIGNPVYATIPDHTRYSTTTPDHAAPRIAALDARSHPVPRDPRLRTGRRCAADHCAMGALPSRRGWLGAPSRRDRLRSWRSPRGADDRVGTAHCPDRGHPGRAHRRSSGRGASCCAATTAQPIVWRITR